MNPVKALLLGAGSRGTNIYSRFAALNPGMLQIVAVADPVEERRKQIQEEHKIAPEFVYSSWEDAFDTKSSIFKRSPVEAVIIATQDRTHKGPMLEAIKANLHILCEKPIVPFLEDCHEIEQASAKFGKVFMVAHVLKYTPFFSKIKELLDNGRIGRLIGMDLVENVGHIHISHNFVRGDWRKLSESSPMILSKCSHDTDILAWLAGSSCESLSSYGGLNYFKSENAPPGATRYCLDGCPHGEKCPYHVSKIYLGSNTGWPVNTISDDLSLKGRIKALEDGPYGRCVFFCDNDVVDHQTVSLLFANGVSATFTMTGFSMHTRRTITLFGSTGELNGDMEGETITIKDFITRNIETISIAKPAGSVSAGDSAFIRDFVNCVQGKGHGKNMIKNSFESHYMAFAAEASRHADGKTVQIEAFRQ